YTDPELGLVNAEARWYDPSMAAFVSRDTWTLAPLPLPQANRYLYGNGSPLSLSDLDGHRALAFTDGAQTKPTAKPKPKCGSACIPDHIFKKRPRTLAETTYEGRSKSAAPRRNLVDENKAKREFDNLRCPSCTTPEPQSFTDFATDRCGCSIDDFLNIE